MKRKIIMTVACVMLLSGIVLLCYPYLAQWLYEGEVSGLMNDFDRRMEGEETVHKTDTGEFPPYLKELYYAMQAYNEDLFENGQAGFKDAYSYQPASFDLTQYGFPDQMIGYIDIPKMGIKLPITLGATRANMRLGAVHLTETSLPIGGINTNSVIAAHRGSTTAMFRDILVLEPGDLIYVTNPWETLTYRVAETKVIDPDDVNEVKIQEGRDLITLFTCHPFRLNYQRYLVYCERV